MVSLSGLVLIFVIVVTEHHVACEHMVAGRTSSLLIPKAMLLRLVCALVVVSLRVGCWRDHDAELGRDLVGVLMELAASVG